MRQATPVITIPNFKYFFAFKLAVFASSYLPAAKLELTLAAFIRPMTPNGRQQNSVTKIDSTKYVLGQAI